jgi:hypothetical protein
MAYRIAWNDRLPYPIRDTLRRWREMVGMVLGVGIALGIGMTFLGISRAEMELYTADYRRSGADLYVTTQGGKLIAYLPGDTPGVIKQAGHSLAQIRALPSVNEAIGLTASSLERDPGGPRRKDAPKDLILTMGVDGDPMMVANALVIEQGRWIRRHNEVFIGTKLAREKRLGIGDSLRLNEREFRVVGIGKLRGAGFTSDAVAYLDRQALRQRADVGDNISFIVVDSAQPETTRRLIHELGSYAIQDLGDIRQEIDRVYSTALALYWILIALTLAIAGLFVSNMLSHSVAERRMEFATLRAIGVPSRHILLTIAVEASVISVTAWLVGLLVSFALGGGINRLVAPQYGIESLYTADAQLFALIFALALGLGVVSGLLPARKATHIDPIIVLRES